MDVKNFRLADLKPYEKNPRKNDNAVDAVANSIDTFGFKVPLVIDADNVIVCGHTRYKAAQKLGLEYVPCIIADDLSPEQIKAFRLADNKTAEFASWDFELLDVELDSLAFDMKEFGFDSGDLLDVKTSIPQKINAGTELSIEDFDDGKFKHTCPRCHFKF